MMLSVKKKLPSGLTALLGTIVLCSAAQGQSRFGYERAGDRSFEQKDFGAALHYYQTALSRKPEDPDLLWKSAESAYHLNAYILAEQWYRRLAELNERRRAVYPLLWLRLGEVLRNQGKYEEALLCFERFLERQPVAEQAERARQLRDAARWAKEQPLPPNPPKVSPLGKHINSPYSDFAPVPVGDTLFFSSYRFDKRGDKSLPKTKLTRVMLSVNNGRAREAGRPFPAVDTAHVAHTVIFGEGHFLLFTLCKSLNAADIRCDLWLAVQDVRKRWTAPIRLPEPVNAPGFTTTQPHVAYDSTSEQLLLWFASNRPGGKGGLDIWYTPLDTNWFCPCHIPVDARKPFPLPSFFPPRNAHFLNTPADEVTPFFHAPSRRLYFSSNGRVENFGGFDIYSVPWSSGGEEAIPENAGLGVNTSYNDLYYSLSPDGRTAYLSSNRPGAQYLDEANKFCCNDLFSVQFALPPDTLTPPIAASPPYLPGGEGTPSLQPKAPELSAPPRLPKLTDFIGLPLYFDNDEPDRRSRRTTTQKNYAETAIAYLERQAEYRERFAAGLSGARRDSAEQMVDEFFEQEVRQGYERLEQLCALLVERLSAGEPVEVILKGYTSPRAESDYNLALGKRRISSVRNYFEACGNGILQPYLKSGQLKISEVSFGETKAPKGISDDLRDERGSIYHPAAARERRVEIVGIR